MDEEEKKIAAENLRLRETRLYHMIGRRIETIKTLLIVMISIGTLYAIIVAIAIGAGTVFVLQIFIVIIWGYVIYRVDKFIKKLSDVHVHARALVEPEERVSDFLMQKRQVLSGCRIVVIIAIVIVALYAISTVAGYAALASNPIFSVAAGYGTYVFCSVVQNIVAIVCYAIICSKLSEVLKAIDRKI